MPNRKRRGRRTEEYATREDVDRLRNELRQLALAVSRSFYIQPVAGGGAAGDDGYERYFDGAVRRAETVETITDGAAPGSSPTPTVRGGPRWLCIEWAAVANADFTKYEVHISTSSGFTPDSSTLAADMAGTLVFVRAVNGTELAYETDYYVKLIAKDDDGSAAASVEVGPTQLDPNGTDDFLAGSITAEKLAAVIAMASKFIAGIEGAERFEFGVMDDDSVAFRAWGSDGAGGYVKTFEIDSTGQVLLRGQVYFGTGSRLMPNDVIEVQRQPVDFESPALLQSTAYSNLNPGNGTSWRIEWDNETQDGSLLLLQVVIQGDLGQNPRTISDDSALTAAGWSQIYHEVRSELRMYVYKKENAPPETETPLFDLGTGSAERMHHRGIEYSGVNIQDVAVVVAEEHTDLGGPGGPATTISVGPTTTPDPAVDQMAVFIDAVAIELDSFTTPDGYSLDAWANTSHDNAAGLLGLFSSISSANLPLPAAAQTPESLVTTFASGTVPWLAMVVTFEADPVTSVATPGDGKVRLYAKENAGVTGLHIMDEVDRESSLALAPVDERWAFSYFSATHDPASIAAHTAATHTFTSVPDLAVGDLIIFLDKVTRHRALVIRAEPVCTVAGQFDIGIFNSDANPVDPGSDTYHFLIIHRS